ncbi:MAG: hypothetical protein ACOX1P_28760 [Thermoguttaceae bacterium]
MSTIEVGNPLANRVPRDLIAGADKAQTDHCCLEYWLVATHLSTLCLDCTGRAGVA